MIVGHGGRGRRTIPAPRVGPLLGAALRPASGCHEKGRIAHPLRLCRHRLFAYSTRRRPPTGFGAGGAGRSCSGRSRPPHLEIDMTQPLGTDYRDETGNIVDRARAIRGQSLGGHPPHGEFGHRQRRRQSARSARPRLAGTRPPHCAARLGRRPYPCRPDPVAADGSGRGCRADGAGVNAALVALNCSGSAAPTTIDPGDDAGPARSQQSAMTLAE